MPRKRRLPEGMWDREGTYYARFRAGGRFVRKRLSTDYRTACELLNELKARADRADFGLLDNSYPWAELKREFLAWARQSVRNPRDYEQDLRRFEEYAKIKNVAQVTFELVYGFREWRLTVPPTINGKGKSANRVASPRTVNRQVGTLNNMLNKAVEWRRIGSNPILGIKPLPHDTLVKDRRALSVQEVLALFEASPEHLKPVWRMFMCTGIRLNELVRMKFADVDFDRKSVTVRASTAKNHKTREIPLDDELLETIRQLQDSAKHRRPGTHFQKRVAEMVQQRFSREHVFVTKANTPWKNHLLERFYAVCKKAGIEGAEKGGSVDIHSLRVSFATLSLEHGANPKDVQAILGHGTLKMTMSIYSKATERGKRAAISRLPFAKASAPDHLISVQFEHSVRTSTEAESQVVNG